MSVSITQLARTPHYLCKKPCVPVVVPERVALWRLKLRVSLTEHLIRAEMKADERSCRRSIKYTQALASVLNNSAKESLMSEASPLLSGSPLPSFIEY